MLKRIVVSAVALTMLSNAVQAENSQAKKVLGQLMAVMVMSERCQAPLSTEIIAQVEVEGTRMQKAAGVEEEAMSQIGKEISDSVLASDCPTIKENIEKVAKLALSSAKEVATITQVAEYNWGALSVDTTRLSPDSGYGIGGGDTEDEAKRYAQKFCAEYGGRSCQVVLTYEQCGAIAVRTPGNGSYGWAKAKTEEAAKAGALQACDHTSCKVIASDCN